MPLDARIPLMGNNVSFSQPLLQLGEKRRQEKLDESNLATASQNRDIRLASAEQSKVVNEQNITLNNRSLDRGQKELDARAMQAMILDIGTMNNLVQEGNVDAAGQVGMNIRERMIKGGKDTSRWDGVLAGIKQSPEAASELLSKASTELQPMVASLMAQAGIQAPKEENTVLKNNEVLLDSNQNVLASNRESAEPELTTPEVLLTGFDGEERATANALFVAAGGGTAGIEQIQTLRDKGAEAALQQQAPQALKKSYPNASPAEMAQLQAAIDNAPSVAEGMQKAGEVRAEQRRLDKAKGYQDRAVSLLQRIVDHPELNDVTGSMEGGFLGDVFSFFDQDNSDLIADIDEATSILTTDNMDLMTGVLSESDIQLLKELSAGGLSRKRGLKQFKSDVSLIIAKLGSVPVQTVDEQTAAGDQEGDTATHPQTGQRLAFQNGEWRAI